MTLVGRPLRHGKGRYKKRRAPRFRKRPSYLDGGKPNSVSVIAHADDHLSQSRFRGTAREPRLAVIDRRYSYRDATIPEDRNGPAVLPLFCLAPHGVFRASRIAPRAVSSYLAFSPLPALLSKNRRCLFCDTFRRRNFSTAAPAYFTRHAAVWCSDFPPANPAKAGLTSDHLPSKRILAHSGLTAFAGASGR